MSGGERKKERRKERERKREREREKGSYDHYHKHVLSIMLGKTIILFFLLTAANFVITFCDLDCVQFTCPES